MSGENLLTSAGEEDLNRDNSYHIVLLHPKLRQRYEDLYLIDLANALKKFGHKVTIFTSSFDEESPLDDVHPITGQLRVLFSGWWIPNSICGAFKRTMIRIKAAWMAWRLIFAPPKPKPKVVILDIDPIALFILSWFSRYKTIYIHHFPQLHCSDYFQCSVQVTADLITAKALRRADQIIIQNRCLQEIFRKSFPKIQKDTFVLHPCFDTGLWLENPIDIKRIMPDLPKDHVLFVTFGDYKKRSNFKLILDALEHLFSFMEGPVRETIHMVIAGHYSERSLEQKLYYNELINKTKEKAYASQVTFLKQLPTVHKKTLIMKSTVVIHPTRHDAYPGPILAAMSLGRPVIAVNCGFAADVVINRLNGILVEPDPHKFALMMFKLAISPTLRTFLGDMARNSFCASYSFDRFAGKLNNLVLKQVNPEYESLSEQFALRDIKN